MPNIKLQSSDGEIFEIEVEIARQSVTIKTMLEGKLLKKKLFLSHILISVLIKSTMCSVKGFHAS